MFFLLRSNITKSHYKLFLSCCRRHHLHHSHHRISKKFLILAFWFFNLCMELGNFDNKHFINIIRVDNNYFTRQTTRSIKLANSYLDFSMLQFDNFNPNLERSLDRRWNSCGFGNYFYSNIIQMLNEWKESKSNHTFPLQIVGNDFYSNII